MRIKREESSLLWDGFDIKAVDAGDVIAAIVKDVESNYQDVFFLVGREGHSETYTLVDMGTGEIWGTHEVLSELIYQNIDADTYELRNAFVPTITVKVK